MHLVFSFPLLLYIFSVSFHLSICLYFLCYFFFVSNYLFKSSTPSHRSVLLFNFWFDLIWFDLIRSSRMHLLVGTYLCFVLRLSNQSSWTLILLIFKNVSFFCFVGLAHHYAWMMPFLVCFFYFFLHCFAGAYIYTNFAHLNYVLLFSEKKEQWFNITVSATYA